MRVLVCGGRDFKDEKVVFSELDKLDPSVVIEGGAKGADTLAYKWATSQMAVDVKTFEANWDKDGKAAGPIRNQRMIDEGKPDLVLAFAGGRGTADMVRRAERAGIKVKKVF